MLERARRDGEIKVSFKAKLRVVGSLFGCRVTHNLEFTFTESRWSVSMQRRIKWNCQAVNSLWQIGIGALSGNPGWLRWISFIVPSHTRPRWWFFLSCCPPGSFAAVGLTFALLAACGAVLGFGLAVYRSSWLNEVTSSSVGPFKRQLV